MTGRRSATGQRGFMWKDQAFEEMIESYLAKEHSDIDLIVVASGPPEMKRRDELPPFRSSARIQDIWTPSRRTRCCAMTKLRRQRARLKQSLEDPNAVISFDRKMRRGSPGFMNAEWNQKSLAAKGNHQLNCNRWI